MTDRCKLHDKPFTLTDRMGVRMHFEEEIYNGIMDDIVLCDGAKQHALKAGLTLDTEVPNAAS